MAISSRAPARGRRGVREAIGLTRDDEGEGQPRAQTTAKAGESFGRTAPEGNQGRWRAHGRHQQERRERGGE